MKGQVIDMEENKEEVVNTVPQETAAPEIDYEKIIAGVVSKMQESKVEEKVDNPQVTNNNDEYLKKYVEFENKYNHLNDDYKKLQTQLDEANNKLAEANNKLKDYETFGKTADEVQENSRIVKDYKKQQGGLMKI
jgi:chromosome segregation ATPase